ncbi:hypothetical protein [Cognaticolwellia aestuarii]|uniref:COG4648 family protein n=1 Tax=Cognaticolwellia aestuarii TaxID=329993 RepID=UPI001F36595C|nr:hypothetical protein [Cognaticolwellia aestuarii]
MKFFITALTTGVLLMYPFAVYIGLNNLQPGYLAIVLVAFVLLRIFLVRSNLKKLPWLLPASVLGIVAILVSAFTDSIIGFKLYPLAINFAMLMVFAFSYFKPPTVIETFARLSEKNLPPSAIKYTAKVTLVWCLFFIINGLVSLYTAVFMSLDSWMIYNGFISYVLMGILMLVEYLVRLKVKKQQLVMSAGISKTAESATSDE